MRKTPTRWREKRKKRVSKAMKKMEILNQKIRANLQKVTLEPRKKKLKARPRNCVGIKI